MSVTRGLPGMHPSEAVAVGDVVKVWVVDVDQKKKRIALTMVKGRM